MIPLSLSIASIIIDTVEASRRNIFRAPALTSSVKARGERIRALEYKSVAFLEGGDVSLEMGTRIRIGRLMEICMVFLADSWTRID